MSQSQPVENPAEQMKSGKEGKKSVIEIYETRTKCKPCLSTKHTNWKEHFLRQLEKSEHEMGIGYYF